MDFMNLLKSVEQFLYEVVSWLVFYPITLWRTLRHPLTMMCYSHQELRDDDNSQFTEAMSPPLFLLITLLISRGLGLGVFDEEDVNLLPAAISSETNILILTSIIFSVFPLAMAVTFLKRKGVPIDRELLKAPFYGQCYVTAPFAFAMSVSSSVSSSSSIVLLWAENIIFYTALVWFAFIEIRFFRTALNVKLLTATLLFLRAFALAMAIIMVTLIGMVIKTTLAKNIPEKNASDAGSEISYTLYSGGIAFGKRELCRRFE